MANGARTAALVGVLVVAGAVAALTYNQIDARRRLDARVHVLTGGDPEIGRADLANRPCGSCHEIPGVAGAVGRVGPPLVHFAGRTFIGGRATNTPENLVRWIEDPHTIDPQSAMPAMGVGDREARDMAAYLYTLS